MSPNQWGPPIWTFFHTLAEKINEDKFQELFPLLFNFIRRICGVLPCPECSQHAITFLSKINSSGIKNKDDFRNIIFIFHNSVNQRKNKPAFKIENVSSLYSNINIINAYNNFISVFHTKGNMKLLAETFQRKIVLQEFRRWFMHNIRFFL